MAMKVANFRLLMCTICMIRLLITQSYLLPCLRTSRMRLMSEKAPGAIVNERKQFDFKELIERCSQNAVYTPAVKAAAEYLRSSETLSQSGVNSVIKIYGLAAMVDDAIDALSYAESRGIILNVRHYNAVISVCGKHKRYDDAVVVYERFLEACRSRLVPSMSPDIVTRNNMIGILGDKGDWQRALEIFREVSPSERDSILYTTILRAFQKNNRPSEALEVFGEMFSARKKNNTKNNQNNQNIQNAEQNTSNSPNTVSVCPTVQMYTSLISTFGKDGDWERSWGIFQNMQKADGEFPALIPDKVLVLTMVRILEKAGQLEKAALVKQNSLRHSQQHSLPGQGSLTPPKFNDLIREGKRSGDFRAAVAAADEWIAMKNFASSPSVVTACINIYGLALKPYNALSVLAAMNEAKVEVNVVQYNAIMAACVKGSKIEEALKLFSYMTDPPLQNESDNINENENPLTNKISPSNSQDSSSPVQNNPYARFKVPLVRDAYSFGTALHALGKQGSWAKSLALLNFLHEKTPLERTTVMCNTVLSTLGRAEQCDAAAALFEDMTLNGPSPDKVTNQTMVSVFERVYRYEEAAVFRSILNMAPAIVRTGKGQAHVQGQGQGQVSPSTSTKTEKKTISLLKMNNDADDDNRIPSQVSILNGSDGIIQDSTAATVNTDDQNEVLTYVQNDPTPLEDYYPDMIRLSPAGTLKDKLLADGRRVGKKKKEFPVNGLEEIVSTARTVSDVLTNDGNEKAKKVRSKKSSVEIRKSSGEGIVGEGIEGVEKIKSKLKTKGKEKEKKGVKRDKEEKNSSRNEGREGEEGGVEGGDMKWEKGGGGAAAMIRLLGIAGKTTEALELFLSLEKEGEKGSVPLPTSLYNAAISACAFDGSWETAVAIYDRMLLPSYTVQGTGTGSGIGEGRDSSSSSMSDGTGIEEIKGVGVGEGEGKRAEKSSRDTDRGEDRSVSGTGGGVARDVGTYKALIPILETASTSTTSTLPSSSTSTPTTTPTTTTSTSSTSTTSPSTSTPTSTLSPQVRSLEDIERARTTLESVRRTGRIEGLIY